MPSNKKISELTEFTAAQLADDDLIVMVDVSDSTTKKVAASTFRATVAGVESLTAVAPLSVDAPNGDVTIQITDPLPIANGGTAATTASVARTNLGLGTIATQNSNSVSITGGAISGITDLAIADGGTGASTAADARTNLGVTASGSDTTYAYRANNLSDLANAATARTNLGVTATGSDTTYAYRANNLSDLASASVARTNLGLGTIATQDASNVSITGGSISGITDLAVADGGTGASNAAAARTNLGAAASGANSDITSLTGLTTPLSVPQGGTGATTLTSNNVILGNGSSAVQFVAPGTSGNVLTSNGTTWSSSAPASSGVTSFSAGTTGFTPSTATTGAVTLAGTLAIANGGTGATSSSTAATALGVGTGDSPTFAGLNIDTNLGVDGQWNTSGLTVYANGVTPQHDGPLHVMSGSAGAVTASTAADELIVEGPGNAAGGISILNADANDCNIFFGNASDNLAAMVQWNYTSKLLALSTRTTGGYLKFGVEDEGYRGEWNTTGLTCYASGVTPQHDSPLHVMSGSAGTITAPSFANDFVVENSGDCGISVISPAANVGYLTFPNPTNAAWAVIEADYTNSLFTMRTGQGGKNLLLQGGDAGASTASLKITGGAGVTVYSAGVTSQSDGVLHVMGGSAGAVTASVSGDELILENSSQAGLSILCPDANNGQIYFGNPASSTAAYLQWLKSINTLRIGTIAHAGSSLEFYSGAGTLALTLNSDQTSTFAKTITVNPSVGNSARATSVSLTVSSRANFTTQVGQWNPAISTVAAILDVISTDAVGIVTVRGEQAGNKFADCVFFHANGAVALSSGTVGGTPAARTYSVNSGVLRLAMASGTYTVAVGGTLTYQ